MAGQFWTCISIDIICYHYASPSSLSHLFLFQCMCEGAHTILGIHVRDTWPYGHCLHPQRSTGHISVTFSFNLGNGLEMIDNYFLMKSKEEKHWLPLVFNTQAIFLSEIILYLADLWFGIADGLLGCPLLVLSLVKMMTHGVEIVKPLILVLKLQTSFMS